MPLFGTKKKKSLLDSTDDDDDVFDDLDQNVELEEESDEQDYLNDGSDTDVGFRALRTAPGKSSEDEVLINAISQAMRSSKHQWKLPDKFTVAFAVIGGVGGMATTVFDTVIGETTSLKELVPMSKEKRWPAFVSATMAAGYVESIPGLSMIGGPIMAAATARTEKKGVVGVVRSAGKAAAAGAIDTALGVASGGGYAVYQLATAWLVSAGAVWLKAKFYLDTYRTSADLFQQRANELKGIFKKLSNVSGKAVAEYQKKMTWLIRQRQKCLERGREFEKIVRDAEQKFDEAVEKAKARLKIKSDPMKESLLGRSERSDDDFDELI